MSTARAVNQLADVICRAQKQGRVTPAGIAMAVDAAGLLQSPETAAELDRLRAARDRAAEGGLSLERLAEIKDLLRYESSIAFYSHRAKESLLLLVADDERLRARVAELEQERHTTNNAVAEAHLALATKEPAETTEAAAVRRSVDAQFPLVAAFLAEDPHGSGSGAV